MMVKYSVECRQCEFRVVTEERVNADYAVELHTNTFQGHMVDCFVSLFGEYKRALVSVRSEGPQLAVALAEDYMEDFWPCESVD